MYGDFDAMLADPELEAVIVAIRRLSRADVDQGAGGRQAFAVRKADRRLVEEGQKLADASRSARCCRSAHEALDPALEAARDFVRDEMGEILALKAWYCDSTHRYTNTDDPAAAVTSKLARKPAGNPKADLGNISCWRMARTLSTRRASCAARSPPRGSTKIRRLLLVRRNRIRQWRAGHLDLTVAVRMDWHEGFQLYGENGSVIARPSILVFGQRGRHLPRAMRPRANRSAPTAISSGASSKASPRLSSTASRCAARR
jgi:hypothetical protein